MPGYLIGPELVPAGFPIGHGMFRGRRVLDRQRDEGQRAQPM